MFCAKDVDPQRGDRRRTRVIDDPIGKDIGDRVTQPQAAQSSTWLIGVGAIVSHDQRAKLASDRAVDIARGNHTS